MPCIDFTAPAWRSWPWRAACRKRPARAMLLAGVLSVFMTVFLGGCTSGPAATAASTAAATSAEAPAKAAPAHPPRYVKLPPPPASRNWDELKLSAARRLVAAHPDTSYVGTPPEPLLGIPVLEIELNANGSVRNIEVLREPRDAKETIQMAIDAVHRAAPYGDISRLPRPWRFVEVFLFDDDYRFMPATLDR